MSDIIESKFIRFKILILNLKRPLCILKLWLPFFLFGQIILAQDNSTIPSHSFEKFKLPEGHLSNSVQDIVQDSYGFMWFASKNGLHRWDGFQFKTYNHDPTNSTSIGSDYVELIYLTKDGSLFLGLESSMKKALIDRFDYETETFHHYDYPPEVPTNQGAYSVVAIVEDNEGNIWSGTHYGVYKLNRKTGIFKQYLHNPDDTNSLSHNICRKILKDSQGILWFGTGLFWDQSPEGGLNRYRPETDDFVNYLHDPGDSNSLTSNIITELFEDSRGTLWVGTTQGGLHKMDRVNGTFDKFLNESLKSYQSSILIKSNKVNTFVQFIHEDQQNKLWMGYFNGGIKYYDPDNGFTKVYQSDNNDPESLPENLIWSLSQSRDGTLWGSTTGPKSAVFKVKERIFTNYKLPSNTDFVGSFCESNDNKVWVGTFESDLHQLDLKSKEKTFFKPKSIKISTSKIDNIILDKRLLATDQILKMITKIVVDSAGGLWMTKKLLPGLIHFNPSNGNLKIYVHDPENDHSIGKGVVSDILRDDQGKIWMVSANGDLNIYDPEQDGFIRYKYSSLSKNEIGSGYNCQLNQSKDGKIWIVGTGIEMKQILPVLGFFDSEVNKFHSLDIDLNTNELYLFDREVRNVEEDAYGNIWICIPKYLIKVVKSTNLVKIYQTHEFDSEYLKGMVMDNQDHLWLIGEKISFFDPLLGIESIKIVAKNTILNFPVHYKQTIYKDSLGRIYNGGEGEFQRFDPEMFSCNRSDIAPEAIISEFEILNNTGENKNRNYRNVLDNSEIHLDYNQNTFSLRFAILAFQEPQKNRIQFKLDGFEEQWRTVGLEPIATYIKVPPGRYTFQVKGSTFNSDWGDMKQLGILIAPPIWGTWWAYVLYFLLGLGLLYSFYRFQLNRKLEKAESLRLKDLDIAKSRLITNITHEFRTPLTVISGMSEQIKENPDKWLKKGLDVINRNSTRLNNLVTQMLDLSKLESGKLKLNPVQSDIIPFVKYLCESFNSTTEASEIKLTVYAEIDEIVMDFDSSKLSTVIINLLSNAIKYTSPGGKIIVHLNKISTKEKSHFSLKVKDTGVGISKVELENIFNRFYQVDNSSTRTEDGTGIGLALTKELVELMDGNINVKSKLGKGSEFIVQLPITRNAAMTNDVSLPYKPQIVDSVETMTVLEEETSENSELPIVLIIEDNGDVAQYLIICLEERHHVLYAKNGVKGLEMAYDRIPDIVISDVMMPGMDGFEVCSTLKKDERTDHIPVILLTAKASLQDRISGLSHGADAYLTKPFSKVELFTRIDQLMLLRKNLMKRVQNDSYLKLLKKQVEGAEASFLKKVIKQIHEHMNDHSFGSAQLAHKLRFSESQVYRKLKAITGKSTAIFIRSVKLQEAKELILTTDRTISEISYDVGFNDPSWFSSVFKEEFGFSPSDLYK